MAAEEEPTERMREREREIERERERARTRGRIGNTTRDCGIDGKREAETHREREIKREVESTIEAEKHNGMHQPHSPHATRLGNTDAHMTNCIWSRNRSPK